MATLPSSFASGPGTYRVVSLCSAQLVETFGPDGKCLHQEVIIHRLPSRANPTIQESFFNPLLSHGRGITTTNFPLKCSSVITSIYVNSNEPAVFRCGIRAFYKQEHIMRAQDAVTQIETAVTALEEAKQIIEDNDTMEFDLDRKLNLIEEISGEVLEYVSDQT